ncbi:MAG: RsmD family RNA methyltransferase [Candidatus Andersenbacteria bacterium]
MPVRIDKLVFGGQGLGHADGKTVLAWNVLPGETVEVAVTRKRRGVVEGVAQTPAVGSPERSPERVEPHEAHYLSCSPWQVLSWSAEQEWKRRTTEETYAGIGRLELPASGTLEVVGDEASQYGYRSKMEFSVTAGAPGASPLQLAFFERGRHRLEPIDGCELAATPINDVARQLVTWLGAEGVDPRMAKSIVVRSDGAGHAVAAVFLRERRQFAQAPTVPSADGSLLGLSVYYSNPKSPASTPDEQLLVAGQDYLDVSVRAQSLRHGTLGFFQVNVPMFERALADIEPWITPGQPLLDLYGGVGSIGICAGARAGKLTIVDVDASGIEHAKRNLATAGRSNAEAVASTAEGALQYVTGDATVVLDPPRAGLHSSVVRRLLAVAPPRIVYLSCNVSTQARDVALLSSQYKVSFAQLYNFFPRTPHVEGLLVLDRVH